MSGRERPQGRGSGRQRAADRSGSPGATLSQAELSRAETPQDEGPSDGDLQGVLDRHADLARTRKGVSRMLWVLLYLTVCHVLIRFFVILYGPPSASTNLLDPESDWVRELLERAGGRPGSWLSISLVLSLGVWGRLHGALKKKPSFTVAARGLAISLVAAVALTWLLVHFRHERQIALGLYFFDAAFAAVAWTFLIIPFAVLARRERAAAGEVSPTSPSTFD